jgi:hypothetical protein
MSGRLSRFQVTSVDRVRHTVLVRHLEPRDSNPYGDPCEDEIKIAAHIEIAGTDISGVLDVSSRLVANGKWRSGSVLCAEPKSADATPNTGGRQASCRMAVDNLRKMLDGR